jgi:hypothetical protein
VNLERRRDNPADRVGREIERDVVISHAAPPGEMLARVGDTVRAGDLVAERSVSAQNPGGTVPALSVVDEVIP